MPHCIVEYSESLSSQVPVETLLKTVFQTVANSPLFNPENVSVRGHTYADYVLGTACQDFVHITIRLFAGRTDDDKKQLSETLGEAVKNLGMTGVLVSCECVDIHQFSAYRWQG